MRISYSHVHESTSVISQNRCRMVQHLLRCPKARCRKTAILYRLLTKTDVEWFSIYCGAQRNDVEKAAILHRLSKQPMQNDIGPKDMMQNNNYCTSVIKTTDVEGYKILLRFWQKTMQKIRHSTSVLCITDVEGNAFYIGLSVHR